LRFQTTAAAPLLPDTGGLLAQAHYAAAHLPLPAIPGAEQEAPRQEQGSRKRIKPVS
jgi:phospholipase C